MHMNFMHNIDVALLRILLLQKLTIPQRVYRFSAYFLKLEIPLLCCWCPEIENSSIYWAQLSTFYLKSETESSLRNVLF
jgi:hypothetical protein